MVRNIFITNDNRDNISIYEKEPVYVVNFERKDFDKVNRLSETKQSGIYILIGENQRYVGQASVGKRAEGVKTRLIEHEKNKKWWTSCIFFGRNDGLIDKSQLDYLEDYYIERFTEAGFDMANNKKGNTSAIQKLNKIKADEIRNIFEEILGEVANIELFSLVKSEEDVEVPTVQRLSVQYENISIEENKATQVTIKFLKSLLSSPEYREKILNLRTEGKPTSTNILGTEENISPAGRKYSTEIEPKVHLFTNKSKENLSLMIEKISGLLGLKVKKNF